MPEQDYSTQPVASARESTIGDDLAGTTDSGSAPVKWGGVYKVTKPTYVDGDRTEVQTDLHGKVLTAIGHPDLNAYADVRQPADAISNAITGAIASNALNYDFNGTTWDRHRGTLATVVLASGARTTTQTQTDQTNFNHRGIKVVLDVTLVGTGSITASIQGKDANGIYYTLLTGAAVVANSTNVYTVFPGAAVAANVSANDALPRTYRVVITHNNANTITYSVSAELIL